MVIRREIAVAAWAVLAAACAATTPHPPYMAQADGALVEVGRPPPPARVETVPPSPAAGAVWIDGEWSWTGRRWAWTYGRWVIPPSSATFARWRTARTSDGILLFAPGTWHDERGAQIAEPLPLAVGVAREGEVILPHGQPEKTAPNQVPAKTPQAH